MGEPHDDLIGETLVDRDALRTRISELGREIADDYAGKDPLLVAVLKGAFIFMADLARSIEIPLEVDFMAVSSYGASTRSSGVVRIVKDLDIDLADRHVIIVEDIIDSGLTLRYLRKTLRLAARPRSRCAPCSCARATSRPMSTCATSASASRPPSSSATASTSPSGTGTCPTSALTSAPTEPDPTPPPTPFR